jgi:type IV secretion system protein TrbI
MSESFGAEFIAAPPEAPSMQRGKVKRNLHLAVAVILGAGAILVFLLQSGFVTKPGASQHQPSQQRVVAESHAEPQIAALKSEISKQEEDAKAPAPAKPAADRLPPILGIPASEDLAGRRAAAAALEADTRQYETAKHDALIAGSRIIAINKAPVWSEETKPAASIPAASYSPGSGETSAALPSEGRRLLAALRSAAPSLPTGLDAGGERVRADALWRTQLAEQSQSGASTAPALATAASSPNILLQGTVIPCVLLTQISSEQPGLVTAQVSEDVYDSVRGNRLLIPKGSRVVGEYNSSVGAGQRSLTAAFTRLIFPNGSSVNLGAMQAADAQGQSGMRDQVQNHFWQRFGSQFLIAALATVLQKPSGATTIINAGGAAVSDAAGQILVDTSRAVLGREFTVSPTVTINKGYPFFILVNRDLQLEPSVTGTRRQ